MPVPPLNVPAGIVPFRKPTWLDILFPHIPLALPAALTGPGTSPGLTKPTPTASTPLLPWMGGSLPPHIHPALSAVLAASVMPWGLSVAPGTPTAPPGPPPTPTAPTPPPTVTPTQPPRRRLGTLLPILQMIAQLPEAGVLPYRPSWLGEALQAVSRTLLPIAMVREGLLNEEEMARRQWLENLSQRMQMRQLAGEPIPEEEWRLYEQLSGLPLGTRPPKTPAEIRHILAQTKRIEELTPLEVESLRVQLEGLRQRLPLESQLLEAQIRRLNLSIEQEEMLRKPLRAIVPELSSRLQALGISPDLADMLADTPVGLLPTVYPMIGDTLIKLAPALTPFGHILSQEEAQRLVGKGLGHLLNLPIHIVTQFRPTIWDDVAPTVADAFGATWIDLIKENPVLDGFSNLPATPQNLMSIINTVLKDESVKQEFKAALWNSVRDTLFTSVREGAPKESVRVLAQLWNAVAPAVGLAPLSEAEINAMTNSAQQIWDERLRALQSETAKQLATIAKIQADTQLAHEKFQWQVIEGARRLVISAGQLALGWAKLKEEQAYHGEMISLKKREVLAKLVGEFFGASDKAWKRAETFVADAEKSPQIIDLPGGRRALYDPYQKGWVEVDQSGRETGRRIKRADVVKAFASQYLDEELGQLAPLLQSPPATTPSKQQQPPKKPQPSGTKTGPQKGTQKGTRTGTQKGTQTGTQTGITPLPPVYPSVFGWGTPQPSGNVTVQ